MKIYCGLCGTPREVYEDDLKRKLRCDLCRARLPVPRRMPTSPQIRLFCPECDSRLKTPVDRSGKKFRCPFCKARLSVAAIRDGSTHTSPSEEKSKTPVGKSSEETLIVAQSSLPSHDVNGPPAGNEETLVDAAPHEDVGATPPPESAEIEVDPEFLLETGPGDGSGIKHGIKWTLASFARETQPRLEDAANAIGAACLGAAIIAFLFFLAMAYSAVQSFSGLRVGVAVGTFSICCGLLLLSHSLRCGIGPWEALLGNFLSFVSVAVGLPLVWVLLSLLGDVSGHDLPSAFHWQERFVLGVVGGFALWGASHLWRRVHVLLFVVRNFGEESDLVQSTPWEVTERVRKGLLLGAGNAGMLLLAGAGLCVVVAAALVILNPNEHALYAIGPVSLALVCVFPGLSSMRQRRMLLQMCAEMIVDGHDIRFIELRNVAGASVGAVKRTLAAARRSGVMPPQLLKDEVRTGKLLDKRTTQSNPPDPR